MKVTFTENHVRQAQASEVPYGGLIHSRITGWAIRVNNSKVVQFLNPISGDLIDLYGADEVVYYPGVMVVSGS